MNRTTASKRGILRRFAEMDRFLTEFAGAAAAVMLAAAATLGFVQVILRFVVQSPSTWAGAMTQLLVVWMVHLGVALTIRTGALVSVEFVRNFLKKKAQLWFDLAVGLTMLSFFLNLVWYGWDVAQRVQSQLHPALEFSMAWGYAAVPVGAAFSVLATLSRLVRDATEVYHKKDF